MQQDEQMLKIDRTDWGDGPWSSEPDRVDFIAQGFSCLILRTVLGHLCGYVGVPEGHPSFGKLYDDVSVEVHGGLTYSDLCTGHICHVPAPGMPEKVWWLGFDCAHCGDYSPKAKDPKYKTECSYRTLEYVRTEVESLAKQLAEMKEG